MTKRASEREREKKEGGSGKKDERERERNVNNILFTKRYTRSAGGLRFCEIKARIFCVTQISTEKWVTRERDCKLRGTSNDRTNERASE